MNLGVAILITYDFKMSYLSWHVLSYYRLEPYTMDCHTAIENLSDPIGYLLDFTNPYYTALAGNMKARAKKDNSF